MRVSVEGGKYTYVNDLGKAPCVLRYGELWRHAMGDKFTYSMAAEIESLREQVEKLTKELSVLKTTPPHLRQDLHCVASDLSAQVRERDEQLTAALAACEKKDEALDADNSKLWPSKLREEAISIQPDASALNEYRNQVIEECATCCEEHQGSAQTCANAIRGLKK